MDIKEVIEFLEGKPGYIGWGKQKLADKLDTSVDVIVEAKTYISLEEDVEETTAPVRKMTEWEEFLAFKANKERRLKNKEKLKRLPKPYLNGNPDNVLVIGDIHEPFCLKGYLEFCREQQEKFDCGTVMVIGDIVDGASWNFHEKNPDSDGQEEEINKAIQALDKWYQVFPTARVTMGNHDLLIARKMKAIGLSAQFMKPFHEIWNAPDTWEFGHEFIIDNVRYIHGHVGNAFKMAKESRMSTVQGHLHSQAFVQWSVSEKDKIFGLQVGCGIDHKMKAFEYAKPFPKKPVMGCGVVLDNGTIPISLTMKL